MEFRRVLCRSPLFESSSQNREFVAPAISLNWISGGLGAAGVAESSAPNSRLLVPATDWWISAASTFVPVTRLAGEMEKDPAQAPSARLVAAGVFQSMAPAGRLTRPTSAPLR